MTKEPVQLTLTEWAVLGIISEQSTHGFNVARLLAPDGVAGEIWTVPRPLVYRAIDVLVDSGFAKYLEITSGSGPPRRPVKATAAGKVALQRWLVEPVAHVRDARSYLLMKLFFLGRRNGSAQRLVERQLELLAKMMTGLHEQLGQAVDFEIVLIHWRISSVEALERFLLEIK